MLNGEAIENGRSSARCGRNGLDYCSLEIDPMVDRVEEWEISFRQLPVAMLGILWAQHLVRILKKVERSC